MTDAPKVLDVKGLTVRLPAGADRANAIEAIDLEIREREIVCVVGESGSGKSVTAFSIMGLLPKGQLVPTAGSVVLQGEDVLQASPERLRDLRGSSMSMIFQEPMTALNPVIPVGDQILEVLETHGAKAGALAPAKRDARIIELLAAVRLPDPERLRHSYPHQLSGGQRQRIMIA